MLGLVLDVVRHAERGGDEHRGADRRRGVPNGIASTPFASSTSTLPATIVMAIVYMTNTETAV